MAAPIGRVSVGGGLPQDADASSRSSPSSPKSKASSFHDDSSDQADSGFLIPAWKAGELGSLHDPRKLADKLAKQLVGKAGCRDLGNNRIKHKSVGFAAQQFSSGGRSDSAHRKALIRAKAYVAARLFKFHFRASSGGKKSWGGVVAAFKRFDNLFDRSMQEYLVPEKLRGAAPEGEDRREKFGRWLEVLRRSGCWAKGLLFSAHIFTGFCEMNSAPHGFLFRCFINLVSRNIAITSPAYHLSVFTVTGALGILVASLYHVCTTALLVAAAAPSFFAYGIGFAALSGTFAFMAFITGSGAICAGSRATLDIEENVELQETLMREADVQLYQIDTLIKTVVHNLQQAKPDGAFSAEMLLALNEEGRQQGNAYRLLCKALQRKTDGFQVSRVGRSTLVKNSKIAELLCEAYYTNSNLELKQTNATVRMKELRTLMGEYLNGPISNLAEQKLGNISAWWHKKVAKRDSLQRELDYVFLRELAATDDAFLEPENMVGAPKNYVERVAESKQERKDLRIRCEDWCKNVNKKCLTGFGKAFNFIGLVSFANHFKDAASDNRHAEDVSDKDLYLSIYKHHPEVIARNLHCYTLPIRVLMTIPKILQSFCFNWVLAINAQSSRAYSALIRSAYRKITGRLPSNILCTNLGRFFGGFQVVLFTLGLGALANVASVSTEFAINGGGWLFSTIITGTLMAILGLAAVPFVLAASALVYFDSDNKYFKGAVAKPEPRASRIKEGFKFAPLPDCYVAR